MKHKGLEIEEDLKFQKLEWVVQRVGWTLTGMILFLAFVGAFGSGPLSQGRVGSQEYLEVSYPRFARFKSEAQMHLTFANSNRENANVWFRQDFLSGIEIQQIVPEPEVSQIQSNGVAYRFGIGKRTSVGRISIYFKPKKIGIISGALKLNDQAPLEMKQFVYP